MGAPLYNAIMEHSNLFEEWTLIKNKKSMTYINLTEEANEAMVNMDFVASWQAPMFSPMIVEPNAWTSQYTGCYMDDSLAAQVPLVKSSGGRQRVLLDEAINSGKLQSKLDALNAIQATPFTLNDYTLDKPGR